MFTMPPNGNTENCLLNHELERISWRKNDSSSANRFTAGFRKDNPSITSSKQRRIMNAFTETVKKYPTQRMDHSYLALNRAFGLDGREAAIFA